MYGRRDDGRGERAGRGERGGRHARHGRSGRDARSGREARRGGAKSDEIYRHIRTRLRELRQDVGMGVRTLSVLADVPEATLDDVESGRAPPTIATLMALARALGVGVREFFE